MTETAKSVAHLYSAKSDFTLQQIELLAGTFAFRSPGAMVLIFGARQDGAILRALNASGQTTFVDHDADAVALANGPCSRGYLVNASEQQIEWPAHLAETEWDLILLAGTDKTPEGTNFREGSMALAKELLKPKTHLIILDAGNFPEAERKVMEEEFQSSVGRYSSLIARKYRTTQGLRWFFGEEPSLKTAQVLDHVGKYHPLRFFFQHERLSVVIFHDALDLLPSLLGKDMLPEKTHFVFSFSWYTSVERWHEYGAMLRTEREKHRYQFDAFERITILVNSEEEAGFARMHLPAAAVILCNNAALLDETQFVVLPIEQPYDAVLNAKPHVFKRHQLSSLIDNKVFLTYGSGDAVKLENFKPKEIFRGVPPQEVCRVLNRARVGLILSEVEGACYASAEYLLAGLPVVSTPSKGGRDVYYNAMNSRVVEPTPEAIKKATDELVAALKSGDIDRNAIRADMIKQMLAQRANFAARLQVVFDKTFIEIDARKLLAARLTSNNKLGANRNFWSKGLG